MSDPDKEIFNSIMSASKGLKTVQQHERLTVALTNEPKVKAIAFPGRPKVGNKS